ncbi:hypothetical protein B0H11DRAFT_1933639 [Mycena galericulata]|nr:hypothetical protein B0H11DRAFT_1933639 [Mycena galericulata]
MASTGPWCPELLERKSDQRGLSQGEGEGGRGGYRAAMGRPKSRRGRTSEDRPEVGRIQNPTTQTSGGDQHKEGEATDRVAGPEAGPDPGPQRKGVRVGRKIAPALWGTQKSGGFSGGSGLGDCGGEEVEGEGKERSRRAGGFGDPEVVRGCIWSDHDTVEITGGGGEPEVVWGCIQSDRDTMEMTGGVGEPEVVRGCIRSNHDTAEMTGGTAGSGGQSVEGGGPNGRQIRKTEPGSQKCGWSGAGCQLAGVPGITY